MKLQHYAVFSIGIVVLLLSSHMVLADNSAISWKVTIKRNGTGANDTIFWPPELQARKGDTITWINNDSSPHTITSGVTDHLNYSGKVFNSGILAPGQSYSFKIPNDIWSAYYYFCSIHPWMTGKIDVGVAYLERSSVFTIKTDKQSYSNNDTILISGLVNDTTQIMPLKIQIYDSQRNMVFSDKTNLTKDHAFSYKLKATDSVFRSGGEYKIKGYYGFPATVTDVDFFFNDKNQTNANSSPSPQLIPYWIKNNAKWWSENQISDKDFIKGIQYLVKTDAIKTDGPSHSLTKMSTIPAWVKSTAGWWANGAVSDKEFVSTVQFLIDHNIIYV